MVNVRHISYIHLSIVHYSKLYINSMLQCAIVLIKVGNVKKSGIDFTIKGESSEGPVRTTISGTIGSSTITFAESIMPNNRILNYKRTQ